MRYPFFMRLSAVHWEHWEHLHQSLHRPVELTYILPPNLLFIPIRSKCCVKSAPIL